MSERLSQQVDADLAPLFRQAPAPGRQATYAALAPTERGRSFPALGLVVAASLLGVSAASLVWRPDPPASQPAAVETAKPQADASQPLRLGVFRSAPEPEPPAAPVEPSGPVAAAAESKASAPQALPVLASAPEPSITRPPSVTRRTTVAVPSAPPAPEFVEPLQAEEDLSCEASPEGCDAIAVAEADRELAEAYRQAWRSQVPERRLRAVQRTWREGHGYAADDSTTALLEAYQVRTRDIWTAVDQWVREVDGR
jgi:hypothetical protein